jgi:uncharacterized membrane protein
MKTIAHFVQTTIIGGVFFLAPIVVLIVIFAKAFDYAKKGLNAVLVHFPAASDLSAGAATALSVVIIALVCFLAGLIAHTVVAQRVVLPVQREAEYSNNLGGWASRGRYVRPCEGGAA